MDRRLSAFDGAMVVVSLVIGIGIFRTPALVAGESGSTGAFLLAWALGGAVSLMGALVFAEIGARSPRAGGFYQIVADSFHPLAGFLVSWSQTVMQGVGAATVAVIGAEYLLRLTGSGARPGLASMVMAATLIAGLTALNAAGVRAGAGAQNALSLAKVMLIAGLTLAGLWWSATHPAPPAAPPPAVPPAGMLAALLAVFYTYGGYQNTMNLAGDVTNPRRNLPWAVCGGMALVTLLYLGINLAYVLVLGPGGVASSPLVAADMAARVLGPAGESLVSLAIFLSAAGFVNATILHMPRAYHAMAADGLLPAALGRIDPRTQAQRVGLLFFAATALVPLFFLKSFEKLVAYVMFTDTLSLALLASCLFVMRRRGTGEGAGEGLGAWRMPGYPALPLVFVMVVLAVAGDLLARQTGVALAGLLVSAAGVPVYVLMKWRRVTSTAAPEESPAGRRRGGSS
ncbi:MAG: APC family permease [Candidatus Polarisedimenticolia bacterium]